MGKRKKTKKDEKRHELVPVIYAKNLTEAEFYKGLLTSNDIPAIIEDEAGEVIGMPSSVVGQGVPVLVPEDMLDEATEIIAEHQDAEEEEEDLDEHEEGEEDLDEDLDKDADDEDADDADDMDELDEFEGDLGEDEELEDLDEDEAGGY